MGPAPMMRMDFKSVRFGMKCYLVVWERGCHVPKLRCIYLLVPAVLCRRVLLLLYVFLAYLVLQCLSGLSSRFLNPSWPARPLSNLALGQSRSANLALFHLALACLWSDLTLFRLLLALMITH